MAHLFGATQLAVIQNDRRVYFAEALRAETRDSIGWFTRRWGDSVAQGLSALAVLRRAGGGYAAVGLHLRTAR